MVGGQLVTLVQCKGLTGQVVKLFVVLMEDQCDWLYWLLQIGKKYSNMEKHFLISILHGFLGQ